MNIDIHTHAIPEEFIQLIKKDPEKYQAKIVPNEQGGETVIHKQGYAYPLSPGFYDVESRLKDMDARNIDIDFLSVAPTLYYYWADPVLAAEFARQLNDGIYRMYMSAPNRFRPMATVPLHNVDASVKELERVAKEYNFKTVAIGTSVEGRNLDDPEFLPFFKKAEELNMTVLFHPYYVGDRPGLGDYYLTNLVGNPLDTTICISRLVFGGVLQKCPDSQFVFVHAGGYIPFQRGRLQHGYSVRKEPKVMVGDDSPGKYFDRFIYDTITHWSPALEFLIESHGADKVVLGSDYPFDMADPDPVKTVTNLDLPEAAKNKVLGENLTKLL